MPQSRRNAGCGLMLGLGCVAAALLTGCGAGVSGLAGSGGGEMSMGVPGEDPRYVTVIPAGLPHTTLTFSDDFNKGYLDQTKWSNSYESTSTFDGDRPLWTSDGFDFIPGGGIRLRADARPTAAPAAHPTEAKLYTAASMSTYGAFSQAYGYWECKARLPAGQGMFPAFWMLAQNMGIYPPEIDIFEGQGADPTYEDHNWFWKNPTTGKTDSDPDAYSGGTNWTTDFHTYGLAWQPGQMIFYIDGVVHWTVNDPNVTAEQMYVLLDADVGLFGGGTITTTNQFPGYLDVLYVHVYQFDGMPAGNVIPFTWGKSTLSSLTVSPGDAVTLTSKVVNGPQVSDGLTPTQGPHINFVVKDYFSDAQSVNLSNTAINIPAPMQPGDVYPLTSTYTVPTTLAPGIYNFEMTACVFDGCSSRSPYTPGGAPARFTVTNTPLLNLASLSFAPVKGKPYSGNVNYANSGKSATLAGNMWLAASFPYMVTASTVLEFDLNSTADADQYAIGFFPGANYANALAEQFVFQFGGAKALGIQSFSHYVKGDGTTHYMVPVGDYFKGKIANLVLMSTDGTTAAANATFANVRVYEGP